MKAWLKGGLILAGITVLFWLYIIVGAITCTGDMCGLGAIVAVYYGLPSIILAFILGAAIGLISSWAYKKEGKLITKYTKIGFIIGLVWPLWFTIYRTLTSKFGFFELLLSFFESIGRTPIRILILTALSIVIVSWIFWIIGAKIKK